jgi:hypothetical protein
MSASSIPLGKLESLLVNVVRVPCCIGAMDLSKRDPLAIRCYSRLSFLYRLFLLTGAAAGGGDDGPASDMMYAASVIDAAKLSTV